MSWARWRRPLHQGSSGASARAAFQPPLRFVHLSSERTGEPVREDGSFAEKQNSHLARRLVVLSGRKFGQIGDARLSTGAAVIGSASPRNGC
jgi:hypothetical protein